MNWFFVHKPSLEARRDGEVRLIYNLGRVNNTPKRDSDNEVSQVVAHYNYLLAIASPMQQDVPAISSFSVERFQAELIKSGIKTTEELIPSLDIENES